MDMNIDVFIGLLGIAIAFYPLLLTLILAVVGFVSLNGLKKFLLKKANDSINSKINVLAEQLNKKISNIEKKKSTYNIKK